MHLLIYTSHQPVKQVDAAKRKTTCREKAYKDNNWDSGRKSIDEVEDDDPACKNLKPYANVNDTDYDNDCNANTLTQEYKALYYEDIHQ
jgi:hypothetical protein